MCSLYTVKRIIKFSRLEFYACGVFLAHSRQLAVVTAMITDLFVLHRVRTVHPLIFALILTAVGSAVGEATAIGLHFTFASDSKLTATFSYLHLD